MAFRTNELPQNYTPNNLSAREINEFIRYMERNRVNRHSELDVQSAWGRFSNMMLGNDFYSRGVVVGPYSEEHMLYDRGPFTWQEEDFMSDVVPAGNDLMQWIPTMRITDNAQYRVVNHLEWIAPNGWDGSGYGDWLATLEIAECEYGPSTKWNGFQYQVPYGQFSRSTDTFKLIPNILLNKRYVNSPMFRLRGPNAGLSLENDIDFAIARMGIDIQNHLAYVLNYGDASNSDQEWDGLDVLLTSTYVANHPVPGSTTTGQYTSPIIVDGTTLADIATLIRMLRKAIRHLRTRASKRKLNVLDSDMGIQAPLALVQEVGEHLAVNGMIDGISRTEVPTDAEDRLNRFMENPGLVVDGRPVPFLIDDDLAALNGAQTTMTTDVRVLTRRMGGEIILEQEYLDYNSAEIPSSVQGAIQINTELGGIMRTGQVVENGKCFYHYGEMAGRIICRSLPNQAVVNSFSFSVDPEFPVEAIGYTDQYYANFGTPGSIGAGATGDAGV